VRLKSIESKEINGISIRTNNADEMDLSKAKIGRLHHQFDKQVKADYAGGERVYAIYYDYESDTLGDYSVMSGIEGKPKDEENLQTLTIKAGNYLVFSAKGEIPKIVIETWGEIWKYFSSEGCEHKRVYSTDFEFYKNQSEVEINIAVE